MSATYIGDGVYAEWDGFHLILKADDNLHPTDTIYLKDSVIANLIKYLMKCGYEFNPDD